MAAPPRILVLNGPNLNMLGVREPEIYGRDTLDDLRALCQAKCAELSIEMDFRQSNSESELVGWIQAARDTHAGIVINAAALTHSSVSIMDALLLAELPVVELHLTNIFRREKFRAHSYISSAARGLICGFGAHGYELAMEAVARLVRQGG